MGGLKGVGVVVGMLSEPLGGAHRDIDGMARSLKNTLLETLDGVGGIPIDRLLEQRYERLSRFGNYQEQ